VPLCLSSVLILLKYFNDWFCTASLVRKGVDYIISLDTIHSSLAHWLTKILQFGASPLFIQVCCALTLADLLSPRFWIGISYHLMLHPYWTTYHVRIAKSTYSRSFTVAWPSISWTASHSKSRRCPKLSTKRQSSFLRTIYPKYSQDEFFRCRCRKVSRAWSTLDDSGVSEACTEIFHYSLAK
jgi:hypothetical protein